MPTLTIGMATYNDFDGVFFTIQALRLYHDMTDTEIVVIDNYGCDATKKFVESIRATYVLFKDNVGTAIAKDRLFHEASGDAVLCCDSHILFWPDAIARLKAYYRDHPDTRDLLQGPLVYDDAKTISTHFDPVWRGQMWGIWATDQRGKEIDGEPFDIPMQGMGVFSCRRDAWPGFNPLFRGFGGEEGYIHEKVRQRGGKTLCLPWLRWMHRFGRPAGVPYRLTVDDKLRNYVLGFTELGLDLMPVLSHFSEHLPQAKVIEIAASALGEGSGASLAIAPEPSAVAPDPVGVPVAINDRRFDQPMVSCICMTYGRIPDRQYLIEEAIESFLRQDYPNKELIVINDTPGQELVCNAPGVRIINHPERFPSLGEKSNYAVSIARGDLVAPWDDDDISLPWRLSRTVELLGDADYLNIRRYWLIDDQGLHGDHPIYCAHNGSLITRAAFESLGGYAKLSYGYDSELEERINASDLNVVDPLRGGPSLPLDQWFYIYRWGVSPNHISSRQLDSYYVEIAKAPILKGRFTLTPHWRQEYDDLTRAYDGPPSRY